MTKISRDAAIAFANLREFRRDNTRVYRGDSLQPHVWHLSLYGHIIASTQGGYLKLHSCGWRTKTTKERLDAVLRQFWPTASLFQYDRQWYYRTEFGMSGREFHDGLTLTLPNNQQIDEDWP